MGSKRLPNTTLAEEDRKLQLMSVPLPLQKDFVPWRQPRPGERLLLGTFGVPRPRRHHPSLPQRHRRPRRLRRQQLGRYPEAPPRVQSANRELDTTLPGVQIANRELNTALPGVLSANRELDWSITSCTISHSWAGWKYYLVYTQPILNWIEAPPGVQLANRKYDGSTNLLHSQTFMSWMDRIFVYVSQSWGKWKHYPGVQIANRNLKHYLVFGLPIVSWMEALPGVQSDNRL